MQSLWNDAEASRFPGDLGQRVYTSRLLGRNADLVLHGGGNTSVKVRKPDLFGDELDVIYVKGSGWNLVTIEAAGFAPLRLEPVRRLVEIPDLSDTQMVQGLRSNLIDPTAPSPSVETILHANLPHKYVDHTHADAFVAISNTADGPARVREIYGDEVVYIPYVMPGFRLARRCAELFAQYATDKTIGMALLNHGLFTFGETARESYERMIDLVSRAEAYLQRQGAWQVKLPSPVEQAPPSREAIADLRHQVSTFAGAPMLLRLHRDAHARAFAAHPELARISQQGPITPDHVLYTKRLPLLGDDLAAYAKAYRDYFAACQNRFPGQLQQLDPAPRVILKPEWGLLTAGRTARINRRIEDLYRHTIDVIARAEALGGYQALPAADIFDVEYWELEQAKVKVQANQPMFTGEVVLVTGAASGIGRVCVDAFLARGAAVVGLDLNPVVATQLDRPDYLGLQSDICDEAALEAAFDATVTAFGGLDMLVLNAGIFKAGTSIAELSLAAWQETMQVNLDANLSLLRLAHPLLRLAPNGGRVAVIASKNVPAPGPGAAAYSASKAGLTQLARVAALEWAADGIRVNVLHPNAVFDTGLWTEEVLQDRAARYGLSVEAYRRNNLLQTEVRSTDVANLAAALCGPLFARTTGAQIPIDGGNERVI